MGFFDEVDSIGIAEDHILSVVKLEDKEARALLQRYREVRQELRDRLDTLRGDTFTAQQLRGTLLQVDLAIDAMSKGLRDGMGNATQQLSIVGVENLLKEIKTFEDRFTGAVVPINLNAALIASDTANFLLNQKEASIDAYSESIRAGITNSLTNAVIEQKPLSTVVRELGQYFQGEEWRLERIARTELHNVYSQGKLSTMRELRDSGSVDDLEKALVHPLDKRTGEDSKYLAKLNPIIPIDEYFEYRWAGKKRRFLVPPDRPNDRAILVPYREEWGKASGDSLFRTGR